MLRGNNISKEKALVPGLVKLVDNILMKFFESDDKVYGVVVAALVGGVRVEIEVGEVELDVIFSAKNLKIILDPFLRIFILIQHQLCIHLSGESNPVSNTPGHRFPLHR